MFNNSEAHINSSEKTSLTGAVVLYRNSIQEDSFLAVKKFIGVGLITLFVGIIGLQAGWVINAKADENPVTAPVTSEENPVTAPEVSSTPVPSSNPSNNNGGNNGNSGGGSVGAPSCNAQAPGSAPKIISTVTTGKNEITLSWTKAANPVNNYVIAYGVQKGKPLYGASVGNVTTFSVKGLSGGFTYFFKVRGGNDCQPGAYSEEIAVKVGGKFINAPAQGFQAGVLGKTIKKNMPFASVSSSPIASAAPQPQTNGGLFGKVFNFLSNLFKP